RVCHAALAPLLRGPPRPGAKGRGIVRVQLVRADGRRPLRRDHSRSPPALLGGGARGRQRRVRFERLSPDRGRRSRVHSARLRRVSVSVVYRVGADENGLGGQLGPLVVTAVLAEVTEAGTRLLARRLPKKLAADLNDSKALMSSSTPPPGEGGSRSFLRRCPPATKPLTEPPDPREHLLIPPPAPLPPASRPRAEA